MNKGANSEDACPDLQQAHGDPQNDARLHYQAQELSSSADRDSFDLTAPQQNAETHQQSRPG